MGKCDKPYRFYDENGNILTETFDDFGGSEFHCSKCLKLYFQEGHLKRHSFKCKGTLANGVEKINKSSPKPLQKIISALGRLSQHAQGIDFPMTHEEGLKTHNQSVLIYVTNKKLIGFITYSTRKFTEVEHYSNDDFFVAQYMRRAGIGSILFDEMLRNIGIDPKDIQNVEKNVIVCRPSSDMMNFLLEKKGYKNIQVWR
ncbi:MAG TPA: GNAT family N-acetyltransferase [candidate division Zixibacteria bacterium]|nr:GNAT family N-acetyltransferase [candidate division Zixibacteria bacterium]